MMKNEIREIRIVFFVFCGIFALLAWKFFPSFLSYAGILLTVVTLALLGFSPRTLRPLFKQWLRFAHALGKINTQIILFMVFVLVAVPVGFVMCLVAKDPMKRKMKNQSSYWEPVECEGVREKSPYERQF